MSAKMNWDRVRKETQTRRSGSEWISADPVGATPGKEIKSPRQRQYVQTGQPSGRSRMLGCTCGKAVGFRESHKKRCSLSKSSSARISCSSSYNPFSECIKKAGKFTPSWQFFASLQTVVGLARGIPEQDRQVALKLIRAILDVLSDTRGQKPKPNDGRVLSDDRALGDAI
jgi:hypothetical protein